jgi:hypothetical protein
LPIVGSERRFLEGAVTGAFPDRVNALAGVSNMASLAVTIDFSSMMLSVQ